MRQDQRDRLNDLVERLADVFLVEADPVNWTGAGKLPAEFSREERGDRHWDRKGAMGTGGVLRYALDLQQRDGKLDLRGDPLDPDGADLDKCIAEAERRAKQAMARVLDKAAGKNEFDRRVHGRSG